MRLIRVTSTGAISAVTDYAFLPLATMTRANALALLYGPWLEVTQAQADEIKGQAADNAKALPVTPPAPVPPAPPTPADIAAAVNDDAAARRKGWL